MFGGLCLVAQRMVSFLVLQSSHWDRKSWSVKVLCLLLTVSRVDLQCVIQAFPGHTHCLKISLKMLTSGCRVLYDKRDFRIPAVISWEVLKLPRSTC